jgi:ABC-2 type transport system permease protein
MELLISTPARPSEVMIGKLLPYLVLGWIDAAFCLALASLWFGVPFHGTIFTLFATTSLFLVVVLGIGYCCPS